jgi:glutathione S-transferase
MSIYKLYYYAESSAAACFIAANIGKVSLPCESVEVFTTHRTASDVDFYTINPKGNVPSLIAADKPILNENVAVLQWIADQVGFLMNIIAMTHALLS